MKKWLKIIVCLVIIVFICFLIFFDSDFYNEVDSIRYTKNPLNNDEYIVEVLFKDYDDKNTECLLSTSDNVTGDWKKIKNGKCTINSGYGIYNLFIKDMFGNIKKYEDNYVIDIVPKNNEYIMYKGKKDNIEFNIFSVGNSDFNIEYKSNNSNVVTTMYNEINAINNGNTKVDILFNDEVINSVDVIVSDSIRNIYSSDAKEYIKCGQFSKEEADLVDSILEKRVNDAGVGTRAGVLAAVRFITLEFNYRVHYFSENGRLENYEPFMYVDGEGRYYHKGLYLNESKFSDIKASFVGPAIWGCDLKNHANLNGFQYGKYYPNGLDCSGFVSWALYNGGMNIGDIGAGFEVGHTDYTDIGVRRNITNELVYSIDVKAGDLIGLDGHIAIIAGIDDTNYYIAESLDTTGGVVITTVRKDNLVNSKYKHIILMDSVYNGDGNYNIMW